MSNSLHLGKGSQAPKFPEDGKLRLYSMRFCPFAQRAHLVLEAKNIPYHTANVNLKEKPEWLTQKSPLGKVPALEIPSVKGDPLIESLIIADYLDDQYPQNPLNAKDPLQRARDKILLERFNAFIGSFYFGTFFSKKPEDVPSAIINAYAVLDVFESELKERATTFLSGSQPGFVDYMIWPWFERTDAFESMEDNKFELDKVRFSKLLEWKDAMKQDAAVKAVIISGENHLKFRESFLNAPVIDFDILAK